MNAPFKLRPRALSEFHATLSTTKFVARVCARCGKPGGTIAFRFDRNGKAERDYFHPSCFAKVRGEA